MLLLCASNCSSLSPAEIHRLSLSHAKACSQTGCLLAAMLCGALRLVWCTSAC